MPLLAASDLQKIYDTGEARVTALAGVSFEVAAGDFVALMGPSGCGKSTLLHLCGAMDRPSSGSLRLNDRDLSAMGKWLFIGAVMLMVAGIANVFLQSGALMITLSVLAIGIFSAFILHDLKRVQDGTETNYISAALGVYLSLFNVFQSLLALLGIAGGREE